MAQAERQAVKTFLAEQAHGSAPLPDGLTV
jgi:hypothetical protein